MTLFAATGSEEVGFLKENLDSLYQDLDKKAAVSIKSVRERVKECLDQAQTAFDKLRLERKHYLDIINQQTCENKKIKDDLEVQELEMQGIIIELMSRGSNCVPNDNMPSEIMTYRVYAQDPISARKFAW